LGTRERVRALGCGAPDDVGLWPGDGDDYSRWRWVTTVRRVVAAGWPELGDRWQCWHRVLMPGWGGDREFIRCTTVGPAPIFFALVASSAQSSSVIPAGGAAFGPGGPVIGFFDRVITKWCRTGIVAQFQHFGQPGRESPPPRLHGHQLPVCGAGIHPPEKSFHLRVGQPVFDHPSRDWAMRSEEHTSELQSR